MSLIYLIFLFSTFLFSLWFLIRFILYKININRRMKAVEIKEGGLPIVGHTFVMLERKWENSEDFYDLIEFMSEDISQDKRFWLMNYHYFLAGRLETIQKILTSPDAVEKSDTYSQLPFIGDGIFVAPSKKWRNMRKRLNMTFSPKYYPQYINQINYQVKIFIDKFKNRKERQINYQNVMPLVSKYFFDIVTITHLGVNTKQQYKKGTYITEDYTRCIELVTERIIKLWLRPEFIFQKSKIYKKITTIMKPHWPFLENLIIKSEEYQNKIDEQGNPLSWKSYGTHCKEQLEERGVKTTPSIIAHAALDLLVAGSDTGSAALGNLLYQLGKHPEYQELAYKEIMEILQEDLSNIEYESCTNGNGIFEKSKLKINNLKSNINENIELNSTTDNKPTYSDDSEWEFSKDIGNEFGFWTRSKMDRLRYLDMLIKESLRLCSPPIVFRYLTSDIDVGDYTIPKETEVCLLIKSIQRNPLYWEKPEDFYPDHFSPEQVKARPKYAYLPFSQGPRDCPGKLYGSYIMKCLLAEIIRNFTIEIDPSDEIKYKLVFMIEQVNGYPVKLIPRRTV